MYVLLCLLAGLVIGFCAGSRNLRASIAYALQVALAYSCIFGLLCFIAETTLARGLVLVVGLFVGSIAAALTPNTNPVKRFLNS